MIIGKIKKEGWAANILLLGFRHLLSQDMVKLPIFLTKSSGDKGVPDSSQRLFFCGDTRGILYHPQKAFFSKILSPP
jgi:hypothetical protein